MTLALGIDLGGTKIEIIALDQEGKVCLRRRKSSPRDSYQDTLEALRDMIAETEFELGAKGTLGFGNAGSDFAGDRVDEEFQLDMAERQAI